MGVIIPLITFPYSSRVLGPEALGKVDYAQANMTYFTLLQAFGIGGYAIREGARIRDDRKKMDEFASDMLSINLMTSALAYCAFFCCTCDSQTCGISDVDAAFFDDDYLVCDRRGMALYHL